MSLTLAIVLLIGANRSYPVDCLPDRVVQWSSGGANPATMFGAQWIPGVVLGPPGESVAFAGSTSVAALGPGGQVVVAFDDIEIEDRPGPDFIVFENAFFLLPLPASATDPFEVFVEPAIVEVSADGEQWHAFPHDVEALSQASGTDRVDEGLFAQLAGLAGRTPTVTGNWTIADDPTVFDLQGTAGLSGAGGDAFDLATVGLARARFVRITDAASNNGPPGTGAGFDLDALVVLHGRPLASPAHDGDGDGLSDDEERFMHGTLSSVADTDGDGIDDGREVAGCRDPSSFDTSAWLHREPRLWLAGASCTEARWTFLGNDSTYDLVRGELGAWSDQGSWIDLGPTSCLAQAQTGMRWSCDADPLPAGMGYFYLVRPSDQVDLGRGSSLTSRSGSGACP